MWAIIYYLGHSLKIIQGYPDSSVSQNTYSAYSLKLFQIKSKQLTAVKHAEGKVKGQKALMDLSHPVTSNFICYLRPGLLWQPVKVDILKKLKDETF